MADTKGLLEEVKALIGELHPGYRRCRIWTDEGPLFRDHLAPGYPSDKAKPLSSPVDRCNCKSCRTIRVVIRIDAEICKPETINA